MKESGNKMKNPIKDAYDSVEIPEELNAAVLKVIRNRRWIKSVSSIACVFIALVTGLNISPVFASNASKIPVIGSICRVLTFSQSSYRDGIKIVDVKIPEIEINGENKQWVKDLNKELSATLREEEKQAEEDANEYYDAFINTGGNPKDFTTIKITIDYKVKYLGSDYASFMTYKYDSSVAANGQTHYYNINIKTGEKITLDEFLGKDFADITAEQVRTQIGAMSKEDKELYFAHVNLKDYINKNMNFYLGKDGKNCIVVFNKYDIAVGAAGTPEFVIKGFH